MSPPAHSFTQPLLSEARLGPYRLPNRVVMAPMTRSRAGAGEVPGDLAARYYAQRASAGLIVTEATQVSPQGIGYIGTPGIYTPAQVAGWRGVTDAVHARGGRIFLQLWHVGRMSHPDLQPGGALPVAPSAVKPEAFAFTRRGPQPCVTPRALERSEIPDVVAQFVEGAARALEAGFDGVELHGASGYLIDQFLRDGTNRRTDDYGGSVENRVRFLVEVTEAVTSIWGSDRVGVRLSPLNDANDMHDSDPISIFAYAAGALAHFDLAYLHLVAGDALEPDSPGHAVLSAMRNRFPGVFILNEGYDRDRGNAAIESGLADLVSYGELFLANPDLPERFAEGAPVNEADPTTFYGGNERGYTDYPTRHAMQEEASAAASTHQTQDERR